jgi:uncharacterized protein
LTPEKTLLVFAKAPLPGFVKTRLLSVLSADACAALQEDLVRATLKAALNSSAKRIELWCEPDCEHGFFGRCASDRVVLRSQRGADLGERMAFAFAEGLRENLAVVGIGTDCPVLDASYIDAAFSQLDRIPIVIGPAEDGGYVLLGMDVSLPAVLFEGMPWGTETVMAETRERLSASGLRWSELEILWDLDRPEDLERYRRLKSRNR